MEQLGQDGHRILRQQHIPDFSPTQVLLYQAFSTGKYLLSRLW